MNESTEPSVCPRCDSTNTTCFGHSMCHADKEDRYPGFKLMEYGCYACRMWWKQWSADK